MSNILVILDQPAFTNSIKFGTSSTTVNGIFAGDIAEGKFSAMQGVRGARFDTILVPETLEKGSAVHKKVMSFIDDINTEMTSVLTYNNFY